MSPLAKLRADEWLDLAYTHGTPDAMTITPVAYAEALAKSVEQQHPTATLAAHLTDGRLGQHRALTLVSPFLSDNPTFDIVAANLNTVIEDADPDHLAEAEELVAGLRSLQRMNVLSASWDETATLLHNDLYTPHQLLTAGPGQLTALLGGQLPPERIVALHRRAEELHSTTMAAFSAALSPLSGPRVSPGLDRLVKTAEPAPKGKLVEVLSGSDVEIDAKRSLVPRAVEKRHGIAHDPNKERFLGGAIDHQPTLQALFGDQDACACEHCSSVLSQAAYFVDVLQFIRHAHLDSALLGGPGIDGRRPDLQDLELSCNNTNTVVPAIDLVLEVLENAVALPLPFALPDGVDIESQLVPVLGDHVKAVLEKTVRSVEGDVTTVKEGHEWTVIDRHRRWKLTSQTEAALQARSATGTLQPIPARMADVDMDLLTAGLDEGRIVSVAEEAFAELFAPNQTQPPPLSNYQYKITPAPDSESWRMDYQAQADLTLGADRLTLTLSADRAIWWEQTYDGQTINAALDDLANGKVPKIVYRPIGARFPGAGALAIQPDLEEADRSWTIVSQPRTLTLSVLHERLTISSLAYQSGDPDADALAEPENRNPAAYVLLNGDTAVFPWSLPFDLSLEEVRLYLERARSSRRRLVELTTPVDQSLHDSAVHANELLGLSEAEAKLIAPAAPPADGDIYRYWGLTSTTVFDAAIGIDVTRPNRLELLQNVSILLQQSRLSFAELQSVLATRFVTKAPGGGALTISPQASCKPSEMTIDSLTVRHLDRIHRFVRLQRRLGWSVEDLDRAIPDGDTLNPETLRRLAHLVELSALLDLPHTVVLGWYDPTGSDTADRSVLERVLGLPVGDVVHALTLLAIDNPFSSPAVTLAFCERVNKILPSGIAFDDLRYLLQHDKTPGCTIDLEHNQLTDLGAAVRDAVRSIAEPPSRVPPPAHGDPDYHDFLASTKATQRAREDAAIAALATGLDAQRDLLDDLLRNRLRHPTDATKPAIERVSRPRVHEKRCVPPSRPRCHGCGG